MVCSQRLLAQFADRVSRSDSCRRLAPRAALIVAVSWFFIWTASRTVSIHEAFGTSAYDIGIFDQATWLLSRFEVPYVTLNGMNSLRDHFQPILLLFAPLYWVVPGAATLLVLQAGLVASGAVVVFMFARRRLQNEWFAFAFSAAWLLNPAVSRFSFENFHPDAVYGLSVPLALYGALEHKWRVFALGIVLTLLVKEDAMVIVVPIGLWVAWRSDRTKGILTVVGSLAMTAVGFYVVQRERLGDRIPFGGPWGFVRETLTNPVEVSKYLLRDNRPFYVWQMLAPFGFVFVGAPDVVLISALVLAANIVSNFWYQFNIDFHYSLVAVPALMFAAIASTAKAKVSQRKWLVGIVCACTFWTSALWSPYSFAQEPIPRAIVNDPRNVAARDIMSKVPDDAVVSVYHVLSTHMSNRREVYFFPNPFRVFYYGPDPSLNDTRRPEADTIEYVILPVLKEEVVEKDWSQVEREFQMVQSNAYWQLFRRVQG
jgi:uncharacterized membrane protein